MRDKPLFLSSLHLLVGDFYLSTLSAFIGFDTGLSGELVTVRRKSISPSASYKGCGDTDVSPTTVAWMLMTIGSLKITKNSKPTENLTLQDLACFPKGFSDRKRTSEVVGYVRPLLDIL